MARFCRIILRFLPSTFRERYGIDLVELYQDMYLTSGRFHRVRFCIRVLGDVVLTCVLAHFDRVKSWMFKRGTSNNPTECSGATEWAPDDRRFAMQSLWQDVRYAFRTLRKRPLFTSVIVLTLGLGIGVNTAIFTVADGLLLKPLPYPESDRLVQVWHTNPSWRESQHSELSSEWDRFEVSYPMYEDWLRQNSVFDDLGGYADTKLTITGGDHSEHIMGLKVTFGALTSLRVPPLLGRLIEQEDDQMGSEPVVVLGNGLWRSRFGADPAIIGRTIQLNDVSTTVVGVMLAGFFLPEPGFELWMNMNDTSRSYGRDTSAFDVVIGRLKPGITLAQAQEDMEAVTERIMDAYPRQGDRLSACVVSLYEEVVGDVRPVILLLLVAVGMLLAIACANIASLLLVRTNERQTELAVRCAIGANNVRIGRQLLTEAALMSVLGGGVGVALAVGAMVPIRLILPPELIRSFEITIDQRVLVFSLGLTCLTVLFIGLLPATVAMRARLSAIISGANRAGGRGRRNLGLQSLLVISQIALAFALLTGAGVLVKSFTTLLAVDKGFDSRNVLALDVAPPSSRYSGSTGVLQFYAQLYERLEAVAGVEMVGGGSSLPFTGHNSSHMIVAETDEGEDEAIVDRNVVSGSYFKTMNIPLKAGRVFNSHETTPVAIISRSMAQRFWPGKDPIGRKLTYRSHSMYFTVIGVVGDVNQRSLFDEPRPTMYYDFRQATYRARMQTILLRTTGKPRALAADVRNALWQVDRDVPVIRLTTLEDLISVSVASPRFRTVLLSLFAVLAAMLAAVGIYGVVGSTVTQRTHEIGVRMALGADDAYMIRWVLRRGLRLTAAGLAIGLGIAFFGLHTLQAFVFRMQPLDPVMMGTAVVVLTIISLLASLVPAYRATRVDPLTALRAE